MAKVTMDVPEELADAIRNVAHELEAGLEVIRVGESLEFVELERRAAHPQWRSTAYVLRRTLCPSTGEGEAMNDTLPRAEALVRTLMLRRSGEERLKMGTDMFSASRALIAASLREEGLVPGSAEWKLRLLDRTYGSEISPAQRQRLIERWRSESAPRADSP